MPYKRLLTRGFQNYWRRTRGLTFAAFGVVRDAGGRVLLVRPAGAALWQLPGGMVKQGETAGSALERCLKEQAGLGCLAPPRLFAFYAGANATPADQIALFIVPSWTRTMEAPQSDSHGETAGFHEPGRLPHALAPGVQSRVNEAAAARQSAELW